jgi:signal transduction histidine kinase
MRRLLGTRELVPRLDRVMRIFIGIHLLFSVGFAVSILTFTMPGVVRDGATLILILFVGIYCAWVKKQRLAAFFVLASSMWVFGIVVVGLRGYGMLPSNAFTMNGWQIGSVSEMLLLAFALAYRFNLIRRKATEDVWRANASLEDRLRAREAELTASHERLREIEHRQTLSEERQRLMQDMHDGMGSSLTSALRIVERGELDETGVAQVLKDCIDDLKLAIDSMEPVDADLLLLLATLRFRLGPRLESTGIELRWEVSDIPKLEWLTPKTALHILRILQEAFTNTIKHTHVTEIRVATGVEGDHVVVTVCDNGHGFSLDKVQNGMSKGLSNQKRRAESIGAEVGWDSNSVGTCFTLRLPIKTSFSPVSDKRV